MLRSAVINDQKQPVDCVRSHLEVYETVKTFDFYVKEKVQSLGDEIEEIIRNRSVK
jgi:hypothetical protein